MRFAEQVAALNTLIEAGKTVEAMEQWYADVVEMQENNDTPRVGKAACLAHERKNITKVRSVEARLLRQAMDAGQQLVFSEWKFTFTTHQSHTFVLHEVSVQQWAYGHVIRERFYYQAASSTGTA